MIDLKDDYLRTVKEIIEKIVPHAEVWAFGSRVLGTAKPYSDFDLSIKDSKKLDLSTLGRLREAFQESNLSIRVDFVDWHRIDPEFRAVIERKHEVVQTGS